MIYICQIGEGFKAVVHKVFPRHIINVTMPKCWLSQLYMRLIVKKWGVGVYIGDECIKLPPGLRRIDNSRFLREYVSQCAEYLIEKSGEKLEKACVGIFANRDSGVVSAVADYMAKRGAEVLPILPERSFTVHMLRNRYGMAVSGECCQTRIKQCSLIICFAETDLQGRKLMVCDRDVKVDVEVENEGTRCIIPGAAAYELVRQGVVNQQNITIKNIEI